MFQQQMGNQTGISSDPAIPTTPAPTSTPVPPTDDATLPSWMQGLDPELRASPALRNYKDVSGLAKSLIHAQSMVGADKVVVPTAKSTPDEWKNYFRKVGLPEKHEDYKIADIEKDIFTAEEKSHLAKVAFENNILPHQMEALYKEIVGSQNKFLETEDTESERLATEVYERDVADLQKEWGPAYDTKVKQAIAAVKSLGGDELLQHIQANGYDRDTKLVRMLSKMGEGLRKEDSFHAAPTDPFAITPAEAQKRIAEMYVKGSPYLDSNDPRNKQAVADMLAYQKIVSASKRA